MTPAADKLLLRGLSHLWHFLQLPAEGERRPSSSLGWKGACIYLDLVPRPAGEFSGTLESVGQPAKTNSHTLLLYTVRRGRRERWGWVCALNIFPFQLTSLNRPEWWSQDSSQLNVAENILIMQVCRLYCGQKTDGVLNNRHLSLDLRGWGGRILCVLHFLLTQVVIVVRYNSSHTVLMILQRD